MKILIKTYILSRGGAKVILVYYYAQYFHCVLCLLLTMTLKDIDSTTFGTCEIRVTKGDERWPKDNVFLTIPQLLVMLICTIYLM